MQQQQAACRLSDATGDLVAAADVRIGCAIAAAAACAYLATATGIAWYAPFPNNFDELAHLSYATQIARSGVPWLVGHAMFLLHRDLSPGFTANPNYLNHPPAYYASLSLLLPARGWPTLDSVHLLRLVNVGLSTLAVGCALATAVLRRIEPRMLILYAALVVMIPILPYVGGAINNDNLALLGGSLCILGAQVLQLRHTSQRGMALLILGCALAALAKLTATLMTGIFVITFFASRWRTPAHRPGWRFIGLLVSVETLACLPYAWYLLTRGSPAPLSPAFVAAYHQVALAGTHLHGWIPGRILSPVGYGLQFLAWLFANWNPVTAMTGWASVAVLTAPALVLLAAVPGFVSNLPVRRNVDQVVGAGAVALGAVLPLHIGFSYHMYRITGSPPLDAVPRYYFPIALAVVPLAACWTLARLPVPVRTPLLYLMLGATAIAPLVIARCAGGGCY